VASELNPLISVVTDLRSRFTDVVNVKSYGATGDGETDDTAAIEAAIAAADEGGTVVFPPGVYSVASSISIAKRLHITGRGAKLKESEICAPVLSVSAFSGGSITYLACEGVETALTFEGASAAARTFITVTSSSDVLIRDIQVTAKSSGIKLDSCSRSALSDVFFTGVLSESTSGANNSYATPARRAPASNALGTATTTAPATTALAA
jgi:polygalacturonase